MANRLTDKQKAFIDAYCGQAKMNATEAARMAGYKHPKQQGHETLTKLDSQIRQRLEQLQKQSGNTIADQAEIQRFFTKVMRGEETEKVVANTGKVVEVPVSMKDRVKTAELLGKTYAMFTDKQETKSSLTIDVGVGDDYDADD